MVESGHRCIGLPGYRDIGKDTHAECHYPSGASFRFLPCSVHSVILDFYALGLLTFDLSIRVHSCQFAAPLVSICVYQRKPAASFSCFPPWPPWLNFEAALDFPWPLFPVPRPLCHCSELANCRNKLPSAATCSPTASPLNIWVCPLVLSPNLTDRRPNWFPLDST